MTSNFYVDKNGKLIYQSPKLKNYYKENKTSTSNVIDKIINKLIIEEKFEECDRMKKLKKSLNNK